MFEHRVRRSPERGKEVRPISQRLAGQDWYVPPLINRSQHSRRLRIPLPSRVVPAAASLAVVLVAVVYALAEIFTVPYLQGDWLPLSQGERLVAIELATVFGTMTTIAVVVDARTAATHSELELQGLSHDCVASLAVMI